MAIVKASTKNSFKSIVLIMGFVMLTACVSTRDVWVNYNNPSANLAADRMFCEKDAVSVYPTTFQNVQVQQGQCYPDWYGYMQCSSDIYQTMDANEGNRAGYYTDCMSTKGWALETRTYNSNGQRVN